MTPDNASLANSNAMVSFSWTVAEVSVDTGSDLGPRAPTYSIATSG